MDSFFNNSRRTRHQREAILTYLDSMSKPLSNIHIELYNMLKMNHVGAKFDSHQNIYRDSTNVYLHSMGVRHDISWPATVYTHIRTRTHHILINWVGRKKVVSN